MSQHRFDEGEWQDGAVARYDEVGRTTASWPYENQVSFTAWGGAQDSAIRTLFSRDAWFPVSQTAQRTSGDLTLTRSEKYSLDGTFEGEFRVNTWTLGVRHEGSSGLLYSQLTLDDSEPGPSGYWLRWADDKEPFDYDAEPARVGARAHLDAGHLSRSAVPIVLTDHGRTRITYYDHDMAALTRVCAKEGTPPDQLDVWFDPRSGEVLQITTEEHDADGNNISRYDRDGNGTWDHVTTTTWDPESRIRHVVHVQDGEEAERIRPLITTVGIKNCWRIFCVLYCSRLNYWILRSVNCPSPSCSSVYSCCSCGVLLTGFSIFASAKRRLSRIASLSPLSSA